MDWNASVWLILVAAFGIGALHALEPGHGKSIMGAYIVASHGGVRHAVLLGLVVTVTHTIVVFLLALGALVLADRFASNQITHWLEVVSGLLVLGVGLWMLYRSFGATRRELVPAVAQPNSGAHAGHDHPHEHVHEHNDRHTHSHDHGHAHHGHSHEVDLSGSRDPLGFWTLMAVGASGGLVPCPAALTGLLAAVNLGRPATGIAVVGSMSLGIASTLIAIGILFVQAGKVAMKVLGARTVSLYVPRLSAAVITLLGAGLLLRAILEGSH